LLLVIGEITGRNHESNQNFAHCQLDMLA